MSKPPSCGFGQTYTWQSPALTAAVDRGGSVVPVVRFVVKDLLMPWHAGATWDTLVHADSANNTLGWRWTAGCGADAAPYFRIFHPITQGERVDTDGGYVRGWLSELHSRSGHRLATACRVETDGHDNLLGLEKN